MICMKNIINIQIALLIASVMSLQSAGASDQAIVSWGNMYGRNMVMDARNLPGELTDQHAVWKKAVRASHLYAQPAIVDNKVLLGLADNLKLPAADGKTSHNNHSQVWCLDLDTGETLWQLALGYSRYGVVGSFSVEGDRIYFVNGTDLICADLNGMADGNDGLQDELRFALPHRSHRGELPPIALPDVPYGDIIWALDLEKMGVRGHDATSGTPLILGDNIWVTTSNSSGVRSSTAQMKKPDNKPKRKPNTERYWTPTAAPNIVVVNKESGKLVAQDRQAIPEIFHSQWSSLAIGEVDGEKMVFWGDGFGYIHGFAIPDGNGDGGVQDLVEVWRADANPKDQRFYDDGTERPYSMTSWGGEDDEYRREGPAHIISTPVFHEGKLYVATGRDKNYSHREGGRRTGKGAVTCFDPTGQGDVTDTHILWQNEDVGRAQATPSVVDGLLYIGTTDGFFNCLDATDGSVVWQHDSENSYAERSQIVADGKVYVADDRGVIYVFEHGREKNLLFSERLHGHPTTPIAWGENLLVGTSHTVALYRMNAGTSKDAGEPEE